MSAALLLADHHQQSPSLAVARNDTNLKCVLGSAILNLQSHVVYVTLLASRPAGLLGGSQQEAIIRTLYVSSCRLADIISII